MTADDIDDSEAAIITHRIGQTFEFIRDVLANPGIVELIPDKSRLVFRDIVVAGTEFRLTAYPSVHRSGRWEARVTGPAEWATRTRAGDSLTPLDVEFGETAELALDALEFAIRSDVSVQQIG